MKFHSTMQDYMMHCMSIHLWIVTFKSIIKRSTASFCSLLTGNFVLSAEMAALVADYNADVKERDVKGILLKMLLSLHICLVMYIADYFWTLKKPAWHCPEIVLFTFSDFFPQLISSHTEWFKYLNSNNNSSHLIHKNHCYSCLLTKGELSWAGTGSNYIGILLFFSYLVYCYFSLTPSIRKQPLKWPQNFRGHI